MLRQQYFQQSSLMCDWLTIKIKLKHKPLDAGRITSINADGSVEFDICKKIEARGTYEANTLLRSSGPLDLDGYCTDLLIDGNPSKFLQGQNLWGTSDINLLVVEWVKPSAMNLIYSLAPLIYFACHVEVMEINRVDINGMFQMNHTMNTVAFLIALAESGGTKYQKAIYQRGSVYFNKGSRRWSIVFYNKTDEAKSRKKGHRLQLHPDIKKKLLELSEGTVRAEIKLLSLELKDNDIRTGSCLINYGIEKIYGEYMKRIQINGNMKLSDEKAAKMPSAIRGSYVLWLEGHDIRSMKSRTTFFKHKKILKEEYGIDIDSGERKAGSNVVSLTRVLELQPMPIPDFVIKSGLVVGMRAA